MQEGEKQSDEEREPEYPPAYLRKQSANEKVNIPNIICIGNRHIPQPHVRAILLVCVFLSAVGAVRLWIRRENGSWRMAG